MSILSNVKDFAKMAGNTLKDKSPTIMFVGGVVLGIATVITACKATPKAVDIHKEFKAERDNLDRVAETRKDDPDFSARDNERDVMKSYAKEGVAMAKNYGKSILLGTASLALVGGAHFKMVKRNDELTGAVSALSASYNHLLDKVKKESGEPKALEMATGLEKATETIVTSDENGNVTTEERTYYTGTTIEKGPYDFVFKAVNDDGRENRQWNSESMRMNVNYLTGVLEEAVHKVSFGQAVMRNDILNKCGCPMSYGLNWIGGKKTFAGDTGSDISYSLHVVELAEDGGTILGTACVDNMRHTDKNYGILVHLEGFRDIKKEVVLKSELLRAQRKAVAKA